MKIIDENLRRELLAMRENDLATREKLAKTGELFDGYNAEMEAVHLKNAARLEELIDEHGWLGKSKVGEDGAEAAWLIAQHAISKPDLQRRVLKILQTEAARGEVSLWQAAFLEDRILFYEGKPQIYGTQFNWNTRDAMSPNEIFEPEKIDERRARAGLSVPYSEYIKEHNEAVKKSGETAPPDHAARQREFEEWARKVGWRK